MNNINNNDLEAITEDNQQQIDNEFNTAAEELGIDDINAMPEADAVPVIDEAQQQAEIEAAKMVIVTSLQFAIGGIVQVEIDPQHYQNTAEAYAVLIIKHFPGGLFALLDKYKEELAAGTATILLMKAVRDAKAIKLEQEEKAKQEKAQPNRFNLNDEDMSNAAA